MPAAAGVEVLRADAERDVHWRRLTVEPGRDRLVENDGLAAERQRQPAVAGAQNRRHEVHFRRADEAGDEDVFRALVERHRIGDLHDAAVLHHADAVAHGHGLDLVVGDVDDGRGQAATAP